MKVKCLIYLLAINHCLFANMASPKTGGSIQGDVILSKDIDVISEKIWIAVSKNFHDAKFDIEYTLNNPKDATLKIPLIFIAFSYRKDFTAKLNGSQSIMFQSIKSLMEKNQTPEFFNRLDKDLKNSNQIILKWANGEMQYADPDECFYAEIELPPGESIVRLSYDAFAEIDRSGWVKSYSFNYSLSPAKFWKSFKNLSIILLLPDHENFHTNVGKAHSLVGNSMIWFFNKLPGDMFTFRVTPPIPTTAKFALNISPIGFVWIFGILFLIIHIFINRWYRLKFPKQKFSVTVILGSLLFPFLTLAVYLISESVIDWLIGEHASDYHGYSFMIFIFYPVVVIIQWLITWIFDRLHKRKMQPAV